MTVFLIIKMCGVLLLSWLSALKLYEWGWIDDTSIRIASLACHIPIIVSIIAIALTL